MKHIIITGDVTADWNIARIKKGKTGGQAWNAVDTSRACLQSGGAAMLSDLIEEIKSSKGMDIHLIKSELPSTPLLPNDHRVHHSYAIWEPSDKTDKDKDNLVWRVAEFIGLDSFCGGDTPDTCEITAPVENPETADIVIIDDAGLGFRDHQELWPKAIQKGKKPSWIIVKSASPVAEMKEGKIWHHIVKHHADRTIAVLTLTDLRRTSIHVSRELSWERMAQDLFWELTHNPCVSSLSECAYVIVSIGPEGALLLKKNKPEDWDCLLFFDPNYYEGTWAKPYPGMMIGYTVCLTASVVNELMKSSAPDLNAAICCGVNAMRNLQKEGFGPQKSNDKLTPPVFPLDLIASQIDNEENLSVVKVQNPVRNLDPLHLPIGYRSGTWTILDEMYDQPGVLGDEDKPSLETIAEQIVTDGYKSALKNVPLGIFNDFVTADRREIEGYQSISALIKQYVSEPKHRPLCLAVFGPPGAGKSFGVKQVARAIAKDKIVDITFNISQFGDSSELVGALHQVRDIGLAGKIPLVFWDEFDTGDKEWLRYFLSPMQDGEFQDGQVTHHIGKAVFVFAGGTASSITEFDKGRANTEFRNVKGPDFVSRLHGFLNIIGPNPLSTNGIPDSHYIIRRAILLRELLTRHAPKIVQREGKTDKVKIDPGVLHAFLCISEYKHGVRSIESIISSSLLNGKGYYERSCLPPEEQLNIHVNGREFLALVQAPVLKDELLEKLAASVHTVYRANVNSAKANEDYEGLKEDFKIENRQNVKDIVEKLRSIGYILYPARANQKSISLSKEEIEFLAEKEHWRWCLSKLSRGWVYNKVRDEEKLYHNCLLPWRVMSEEEWAGIEPWIAARMGRTELSKEEKDKDRIIVKNIPKFLSEAGYTVEKVKEVNLTTSKKPTEDKAKLQVEIKENPEQVTVIVQPK